MRLNLRRSVLSVEIASVLALGAFAAHHSPTKQG